MKDLIDWFDENTRDMLQRCRTVAHDGTVLFTPDGSASYRALWTRDFSYMIEYAGDLLDPDEMQAAILYLLRAQRDDGCIPDRVEASGLAVYSAGPVEVPMGEPPTDNSQFMVKIVYDYCQQIDDHSLACEYYQALCKALDYTLRDADGLVTIPPGQLQSPYGFTDSIGKTGALLFSSLLYWDACRKMVTMSSWCNTDPTTFEARVHQIEQALDTLWDDEHGMYLAASKDCRQIDIWGNAFAVAIDYVQGQKRDLIVRFLHDNYAGYVQRGQVRHLPQGEFWERTIAKPYVSTPGTYQNGAYWGTASGWVVSALSEIDPSLAQQMLIDLSNDLKANGIWECVSEVSESKCEHYVTTITNPRGALKQLSRPDSVS